MGLFRGSFTFVLGMGCGVYVAQNYSVPNIKKLFNTYVFLAKHIEETYRKPKNDDIDCQSISFSCHAPEEVKYS